MFAFTYNLGNHGWATATARDDHQLVEMTASYLSDALGDFARAVRGLMRGMPETSVSFLDEPGEHRIILKRNCETVNVTVYCLEDEGRNVSHGQVVLTAECSVAELATTSINCLRKILDEYGEAGYRERWQQHDFPMQEYHDLLELRRKDAAARAKGHSQQ